MTPSASIIQLSSHRKPPRPTIGDWFALYSLCFMAGIALNVALWRSMWQSGRG